MGWEATQAREGGPHVDEVKYILSPPNPVLRIYGGEPLQHGIADVHLIQREAFERGICIRTRVRNMETWKLRLLVSTICASLLVPARTRSGSHWLWPLSLLPRTERVAPWLHPKNNPRVHVVLLE